MKSLFPTNTALTGVVIRSLAIAILSLSTIQAAADQNGPSAEERAKMDAAVQAACGSDFSKFCPTATDHHAQMDCLRANESNLSSSCSAFVAEMKAHHRGPPPGPRPDETSSSSTTSN